MKYLRFFGLENLFSSLASEQKVSQYICNSISVFLLIVNSKMIPREFLGPPHLPKTEAFSVYELAKIIIINKHKNFKFAALQVVAPNLKGFNDSQQFLIMSFVSYLCRNYFSGEKSYRLPLTRPRG